ncbi:MAG: lytic transglycosylase domain-containing protein [Nitrospira sp.]
MLSSSHRRNTRTPRRRRRSRHRRTLKTFSRFLRRRWRTFHAVAKAVLASPPTVRAVVIVSGILLLWLGINWAYHAYSKPTELFFPLDRSLNKSPSETWKEYGPLFREHSTAVITPELLAALAQAEGAGNPVARTYWRWSPSWNPLEWYQPASSAVGMYQLTDGTFREAKRYCIHDHEVVEDGPWHDLNSCWFNSLYSRVLPSHAIELTAALLDRQVANAIGSRPRAASTLRRKQDLAAVIHLCGAGAGRSFVTRGFRLSPHQRCGDHDVQSYLTRITLLKSQFAQLAGNGNERLRSGR